MAQFNRGRAWRRCCLGGERGDLGFEESAMPTKRADTSQSPVDRPPAVDDRGARAKGARARVAAGGFGGSVYDPTDPVGRLLFNVPAMVAEVARSTV